MAGLEPRINVIVEAEGGDVAAAHVPAELADLELDSSDDTLDPTDDEPAA